MTGIGTAPQLALSPGIITTALSANQIGALAPGSPAFLRGGLAIDSGGNVYAGVAIPEGELGDTRVFKFEPGTAAATSILGPLFEATLALALDSTGNLYAASANYACIFKVTPESSNYTVVAGIPVAYGGFYGGSGGYSGDNGPAVHAELNKPAGVAVDSAGNLFIADTGNNRIRMVTAGSGIITTIVGNGTAGYGGDNGPALDAELNAPSAVAVDSVGNLYVADGYNNRIRKVAAGSGIIITVAGNGTAGYSGDNGPATSAELYDPTGIATDGAGDLYVLDTNHNVVRMVNTAGIITTVAGNGTYGDNGDGGPATSAQVMADGLAIDGAGDLYIAGAAYQAVVRSVNVSSGALNFAGAQIGSPTTTQTVTVTNIGNAPLAFTAPASGQNPSISSGFSLDNSSSCPQLSAGSQPSSLASGTSCSLSIDFTPTTTAAITGTAGIADNALNTNQVQTAQLSGGAGATVATTTTLNVITPIYGQTHISATISATAGVLVPAGSIVFTVDGAVQPTITVNGSGVATLPVAVANALAVGSHTIAAVYTSSSLGFANSNATRIFSVSQVSPTVTVTPGATSLSVASGASVTDTLTIISMGGYSGVLQFSCTGLPQNTTCSFQPAMVTVSGTSGPQTTVVTIQTGGSTAQLRPVKPFPSEDNTLLPAAAFWAPGLLTMALAGRKRKGSSRHRHLMVMLGLLAGMLMTSGCGGGGSAIANTTPNTPPSTLATPAGTSNVQITASTAGNTVQSFALTLTVQ